MVGGCRKLEMVCLFIYYYKGMKKLVNRGLIFINIKRFCENRNYYFWINMKINLNC